MPQHGSIAIACAIGAYCGVVFDFELQLRELKSQSHLSGIRLRFSLIKALFSHLVVNFFFGVFMGIMGCVVFSPFNQIQQTLGIPVAVALSAFAGIVAPSSLGRFVFSKFQISLDSEHEKKSLLWLKGLYISSKRHVNAIKAVIFKIESSLTKQIIDLYPHRAINIAFEDARHAFLENPPSSDAVSDHLQFRAFYEAQVVNLNQKTHALLFDHGFKKAQNELRICSRVVNGLKRYSIWQLHHNLEEMRRADSIPPPDKKLNNRITDPE